MNIFNYISFLFCLFYVPTSIALYFHISETERKCFIEELPDQTMVIGNYKVQLYDPNTKGYSDYPGIGMHVEVKDPEDKVIFIEIVHGRGQVHVHQQFARRTHHLLVFEFDQLVCGRSIARSFGYSSRRARSGLRTSGGEG